MKGRRDGFMRATYWRHAISRRKTSLSVSSNCCNHRFRWRWTSWPMPLRRSGVTHVLFKSDIMTPTPIRFAGRCFSSEELVLIRQAAHDYAGLGITEIARTICEWLDWSRPNGRLKNHECRLLLERLRDQGLLTLPPLRRSGQPGPRITVITGISDPQKPIQTTLPDMEPLGLRLVKKSENGLFRQFIQRYHYLGYRTPVGANLRYFVQSGGRILACLQWTSPAWTMTMRDRWIGW